MIFVAGAGGTAVAARAMRQIQRDLDRRFAAFRERRRARRRSRTLAVLDHVPVRVDFDCVCLCGSCGYFVDDADPDPDLDLECAACGESDWIDLALKPVADRLRDVEAEERMRPPASVTRGVLAAAMLLMAAVGVVIIANGRDTNAWLALWALAGCVIIPAAYHILPARIAALLSRDSETPYRWHVPLGLPAPDTQPLQEFGVVQVHAAGDLLTAPFSGRECLAYQVSVLFDAPGDARPPEWALQEQRSTIISLSNGSTLAPEHVYLESEPEEVAGPAHERDEDYARIKRYLRQRGLFMSEGDFQFFEARLEPDQRVNVEAFARGLHVLRRAE